MDSAICDVCVIHVPEPVSPGMVVVKYPVSYIADDAPFAWKEVSGVCMCCATSVFRNKCVPRTFAAIGWCLIQHLSMDLCYLLLYKDHLSLPSAASE